ASVGEEPVPGLGGSPDLRRIACPDQRLTDLMPFRARVLGQQSLDRIDVPDQRFPVGGKTLSFTGIGLIRGVPLLQLFSLLLRQLDVSPPVWGPLAVWARVH